MRTYLYRKLYKYRPNILGFSEHSWSFLFFFFLASISCTKKQESPQVMEPNPYPAINNNEPSEVPQDKPGHSNTPNIPSPDATNPKTPEPLNPTLDKTPAPTPDTPKKPEDKPTPIPTGTAPAPPKEDSKPPVPSPNPLGIPGDREGGTSSPPNGASTDQDLVKKWNGLSHMDGSTLKIEAE